MQDDCLRVIVTERGDKFRVVTAIIITLMPEILAQRGMIDGLVSEMAAATTSLLGGRMPRS
jgi:hypothetical protein